MCLDRNLRARLFWESRISQILAILNFECAKIKIRQGGAGRRECSTLIATLLATLLATVARDASKADSSVSRSKRANEKMKK